MNYSKPLSYSGLSLWKQCPRRWAHQYVEGNREPPGPAARRGTMLHEKLEDYFRGSPYPLGDSTLAPWAKYMEALLGQALEPECKLAVLDDWTPTDFDDPKALARGARLSPYRVRAPRASAVAWERNPRSSLSSGSSTRSVPSDRLSS